MNIQIQSDIELVKSILPSSYMVVESSTEGSIWCKSNIGIRKLPYLNKSGRLINDDEDEEAWERFF
jgi:hypothetical protein